MVSKTTQRISEVKAFSIFMLIASLFFSVNSFSQTITDVFPTRVTSGSEITVLGTGFTAPTFDVNDIAITGVAIDASSITIISDTELKFSISDTFSYDSPAIPDPADALGQILTVGGTSTSSPKLIDYIKPTLKDYQDNSEIEIDEVFTNWNYDGRGYYRSDWWDNADFDTYPNNRHDLLAFTIDGVTYSTGVDDSILDTNGDGIFDVAGANGIAYTSQNYKAYSTNGVAGFPNNNNYLLMADAIDQNLDATVLNNRVRATAYDVIIDRGVNGLDMGTGIANFNKDVSIRFFSGNGIFGTVNDNVPDLLITQIANSNGKNTDIYYYADIDGNIVGRPVRLRVDTNAPWLYKWHLDLYRMDTSVPFALSYPIGTAFRGDSKRLYRMVGLKLSDFGIDNNSSGNNFIEDINNINTLAGGSADMAFIAYNKAAFDIKSPSVDQFPISRNICRVPSSGNSIEFSVLGSVDSPSSPVDPLETISYQWYKDFDPTGPATANYMLPSNITANELGNYKVRISNAYGAVDLPATLEEGGTPTFWNGTSWELPPSYVSAGITVNDDERKLIFSQNYSRPFDLEGCDCIVLRDRRVTIRDEKILKLYGEIIVEEDLDIFDEFGVFVENIPAGQITFGNDASLVQTKPVTTNENSGSILMERDATFLNTYDYMYWSSPVTDFDIINIPGEFPYQWSVNAPNTAGSTGDWIPASGVMKAGKGYIKRFPSDNTDFTTEFRGTPNNGTINVDVFESDAPFPTDPLDRNWNLVGNPYPSALEAETFLVDNTNLEGNVQIWSRNEGIFDSVSADPFYSNDFVYNYGDQYITYNATGPSIPNSFSGKIASGQAFFVQVNPGGQGTVTFNNAMRSDSDAPDYDNGDFFRSMISESNDPTLEKQLIWIGLVNEDNSSSMALVGYVDGATNGVDRMYDAHRNGDNMNIYSLVDDTKMTIQGRSYPFKNSDTVLLGIDLLEDGIYKIAIDHVEGSVFENETQGVYLEDTYLNVIHDLRASPYSFAGVAGTTKDRFVLRYTEDQQLSVTDQNSLDTFIYIKDDRLYVTASNNIKSIVLYDVTGKQVVTYKLGANVSRSFNTPFQYPRGAYIGVINFDNNVAIAKKLIN